MTPDLQTTNAWLAVLAVASALQTLVVVGAAVGLFLVYRKTVTMLDTLEQKHLAPISARASLIMDDLQDVTARARRVDDAVRDKLHGLERAATVVKDVVADRLWPAIGIVRAVNAGLRAFTTRPPTHVAVPLRHYSRESSQ